MGCPCSVYVDRDSIYRCGRAATVAEQVAGQEPQTQFGRAMNLLGVELILATSPQAKGRGGAAQRACCKIGWSLLVQACVASATLDGGQYLLGERVSAGVKRAIYRGAGQSG